MDYLRQYEKDSVNTTPTNKFKGLDKMELTYFNLLETVESYILNDDFDITVEKAQFEDENGRLVERYQFCENFYGHQESETYTSKKDALLTFKARKATLQESMQDLDIKGF